MLFESGKPKSQKLQSFINKELKYLLGLFLLLGLLNTYKSQFISASVNGKLITRVALIKELERQGKDLAVDSLISQELIFQEAKRRKIKISQKDLNKKVEEVKNSLASSQQDLDTFLKNQNLTYGDFLKQVRLQMIIEKLLSGKVKITEEKVNQYIEENREFFPEGVTEKDLIANAREQLKQIELNTKVQELLNDLRKKANVKYFLD